jgi:hypothetical protein
MNMIKGNHNEIAATMKRQPFITTCMEAVKVWKNQTIYKEYTVSIVNSLLDVNDIIWIDKSLFIDAFADVLEFVARSSDNIDTITLTVATSGLKSIQVSINFVPSPNNNIEIRSPYLVGRFRDVTLQIISQHGGRLEFSKERSGYRITLCFPLIME